MAEAADRLIDLAAACADGIAIDWDAAESNATTDTEREQIRRMQLVCQVVQAQTTGPGVATIDVHSSLLHPSSNPDLANDPAPVTWGPLRVIEKIGRGRFGDVYRARDGRLDRDVALKLLRRRDASASAVIDEGRVLGKIRHPNVVTVHGADRIDDRVGVWMELVRGKTLEEELKARGPFPMREVASIGVVLCAALSAVHRAGLVHRDVKAQNVMRDVDGRIVLMDFGTGHELSAGPQEQVAGTPLYLAPEVLSGEPATPQSDLYSLGVLLFHLATGRFPVEGATIAEIQGRHNRGDRTNAHAVFGGSRLALGINRALAVDQARRFSSAQEMGAALAAGATELSGPRRWRSIGRLIVACAVVTAVGGGSWFAIQAWRARGLGLGVLAPVPFQPQDSLLVAAFENRTGESVLDGTIEAAFERELTGSSFVNIVSRERVDGVLRLMQRPTGARVDASLAREVSIRDGGVRVIVTGLIEKVTGQYRLTSQLMNPRSSQAETTLVEHSLDAQGLLQSVATEAIRMREALGEALTDAARNRIAVERVTTVNLRALQLYSLATPLFSDEGGWNSAAAESLLRDALKDDPAFGSAHILLAWSLQNQRRRTAETLSHVNEAVRLSTQVSEVERLFIIGSAAEIRGLNATLPDEQRRELEQAERSYVSLLTLSPRHYWGAGNLARVYNRLDRAIVPAWLATMTADRRFDDFRSNARAAAALFLQSPSRAPLYAERALRLITPDVSASWTVSAVWIRLFGAYAAWLSDDPVTSLRLANELRANLDGLPEVERDELAHQLIRLYATLGRMREAQDLVRENRPGQAELKDLLIDPKTMLAAKGTGESVVVLEKKLAAMTGPITWKDTVVAQRLSLADQLASAWQISGRLDNAIAVLETHFRTRGEAVLPRSSGFLWLTARVHLAELYRNMGRPGQAYDIEDDVLKLLAVADSDHPLLKGIRSRR